MNDRFEIDVLRDLLHGNMKSPVKPITPLFSVSKT